MSERSTVWLIGTPGHLPGFVARLVAASAEAAGHKAPRLRHRDAAADIQADSALEADGGVGQPCAVLAIDDPEFSLRALVAAGHSPMEAARALTASTAALVGLAGPVVRLHADMTLGQASAAILSGLGFAPNAGLRVGNGDATRRLADLAGGPPPSGLAEHDAAIAALARDVVGPLFAAAATGIRQPVTWARAGLFWGDHPGQTLPRVLDLTGPARVLAYGPYFHLPPGDWMVRTTLAFAPGAIGTPFAVELHDGRRLGRARLRPAAPGVFVVSFPVEIDAAGLPIEIRVVSEAGAIDGEIGIDHVRLEPCPPGLAVS